MAADRILGGGLWLSDLPGWIDAPESVAARGAELGRTILGPAQEALGPLMVTSWWRPGAVTDSGKVSAHASGAAADARLLEGGERGARRLAEWIQEQRRGRFGELIIEPPGRHGRTDWLIHVTLPGVGGWGEVLEELSDGSYIVRGFPGGSGTSASPIELEGLDVVVDRKPAWPTWLLLIPLLWALHDT